MPIEEHNFVRRFDRIALQNANKVAVEVGERMVSFDELRKQTNQIAVRIAESTCNQRCVVGLHLNKSPELLAAMIGVWRAGCAWVPLVPELPQGRLEFMLRDSQPSLVITENWRLSCFESVVTLQCPTAPLNCQFETVPIEKEDLAYVIYTSGTTGDPRGVEVTHGGIMNFLDAQISAFRITADSRCLWFYPQSFDASVSDWGTAIASGATLVVEPELTAGTGDKIIERLEQRQITHADLPPALLDVLPVPSQTSSLETIIVGGQATKPDTISRWSDLVRLVNVYGPTEATVCTSLEICSSKNLLPSIGQPIDNVEYLVVDRDMNPIVPGNAGELLIAGDCVARGYLNHSELTQEKFIELAGRRFYRTGDKIYLDDRGEYIFHGRIDRQMSVNGVRVEPEEIEAALMEVSGVTAAAALMRKRNSKSKTERLFAFVQVSCPSSPEMIRSKVSLALTNERVPSCIHILSRLPLSSSGKVDIRALRELPLTEDDVIVDVGSRLEQALLLMREVTGEPDLGPDDGFRDWGGDSLAAIRLATLAVGRGLKVPFWLAARNPTAREIVEFNDQSLPASLDSTIFGYQCSVSRLQQDVETLLKTQARDQQVICSAQTQEKILLTGSILLTGATGFLGCRVLKELLERTDRNVVCVVRVGKQEVRSRLFSFLEKQEVHLSKDDVGRIEVVKGDITKPNLGMEGGSNSFCSVVHCAADMNAFSNYKALRPCNLVGVSNSLQLARQANASFHYASTLSVFVGTDAFRGVHSEQSKLIGEVVFGGYAQSKLAAELFLALEKDIPAHIYRFGLLAADTRTGVFPYQDILTMVVRGLHQLRCFPRLERQLRFDLTPVDYASRSMAAIVAAEIENEKLATNIWHIAGTETATHSQLFDSLRTYFKLESLPVDDFLQRLEQAQISRCFESSDMASVRMSFLRWFPAGQDNQFRPLDLFQSTESSFDSRITRAFLRSRGIVCPKMNDMLMQDTIGRLCRCITEGAAN